MSPDQHPPGIQGNLGIVSGSVDVSTSGLGGQTEIFRDFRDKLAADMRKACSDYQLSRLNSVKHPKHMWKELRNLGLAKPSLPSPLHFFPPNELNRYYASVSSTAPTNTPSAVTSDSPDQSRMIIGRPQFEFKPVDVEVVRQQIVLILSDSYSSGPHGISPSCIRHTFPVILDFANKILNDSIRLSRFPSMWKKEFLRPLSKVRAPGSPSDTRPIANLSEVTKVFERIIHKQIVSYADEFDIFNSRLSEYRKGFSTQTALLRIYDDVKILARPLIPPPAE